MNDKSQSNVSRERTRNASQVLSWVLAFVVGCTAMQTLMQVSQEQHASSHFLSSVERRRTITPDYKEHTPVFRNPVQQHDADICRFYMAESAVAPHAGLGMFVGDVGLLKGDRIGFPDICIFVSDPPKEWTHLRSHSWGWGTFFGQYETTSSRAACEGYVTLFNTMPESHINTALRSPIQPTTAGATRQTPNAGSITHHYGVYSQATDVIPEGSELTIDYGDWDFANNDDFPGTPRPQRSLQQLREDGWCIDYLEIRPSTIAGAGRGAFVKQALSKGTVVAPAPLEVFRDRALFATTQPEQLFVNYCLQPANSKLLFFPYGPGVNLINHSQRPNVRLQWSANHMNRLDLLEAPIKEVLDGKAGSLILEVVATRNLQPGEELFLDYGASWDRAWKAHTAQWQAPKDAETYVYPEDMDETGILRTVKEQIDNPNPKNLITMCQTPEWNRRGGSHMQWYKPSGAWAESMVYCHILDRRLGESGLYEYTVSLKFIGGKQLKAQDLEYKWDVPFQNQIVDTKVPRRAIRWAERPYSDDEHLPNAFRHPIGLPDSLMPDQWRWKDNLDSTS